MNTTIIKPIGELTGAKKIAANLPLTKKLKMLNKHINLTKYTILGFVDRTNDVVLQPRYYNVRNSLGQFAAIQS